MVTPECRIHLQESIPRGQGEVVFPPVVVADATGIHIGAEGKSETTAPAQPLELGGNARRIPNPLSGLAQCRSCEEPLDVRQLRIWRHPAPVIAIDIEPVGPAILPHPTAGREGSRRQHNCPPPSRERHTLETTVGRKPRKEASLPSGVAHWLLFVPLVSAPFFWLFPVPLVSAPSFFFIMGARPLSFVSPTWGTPEMGDLLGRPKM